MYVFGYEDLQCGEKKKLSITNNFKVLALTVFLPLTRKKCPPETCSRLFPRRLHYKLCMRKEKEFIGKIGRKLNLKSNLICALLLRLFLCKTLRLIWWIKIFITSSFRVVMVLWTLVAGQWLRNNRWCIMKTRSSSSAKEKCRRVTR